MPRESDLRPIPTNVTTADSVATTWPSNPHSTRSLDSVEEKARQNALDQGALGVPLKDEEDQPSNSHESIVCARRPSLSGRRPSERTVDGKKIINEDECHSRLGCSWPSWKKWALLSTIFAVQTSMNFNTSLYPSAVEPLSEHFGVSMQAARASQAAFLIAYAFGCELWAPWSEEFGRWPILQASLFLVNIWQVLGALAPNYATIVIARFLGGLSSAGGSVTLGMVADLYDPEEQDWAVGFVVFSSVFGTVLGPVVGGPVQKYLNWHWNLWIQLIFGVAVQIAHFFTPESRATIIMDREAKRLRESGEDPNMYGPDELKHPRISWEEVGVTWIRPFEMFIREPIVLSCSLLSGFSDALIFTFQEGFHPVYKQWGFGTLQIGWTFIPIIIGYVIGYISYFPWFIRDQRILKAKGPNSLPPENRLKWLLFLAPLETIGLFGFAWTSLGPPRVHWIAPMIFSLLVGIANFGIYMSTVSYMLAAYGPYAASATGGNGFSRDFLAGIATMYSSPLYSNVRLEYASTILACLAFVVLIPVYLIYWKGPWLREKSPFAQSIAADRHEKGRGSIAATMTEPMQPRNL
ncbi:hypothetical protein HIM_03689 [Hirsutella minnesotensis 3608]|uniref:Major facilitator superfamily (MFS) profile domain-containing protein n=1 Tax=Hirsutella minnesotensis 3608 TaxID=1043627 RepID=A0A0F8A283_9HYPO|nr:hypothetical protein HIM_03689 [Hirsutella minnesotensis 3608]